MAQSLLEARDIQYPIKMLDIYGGNIFDAQAEAERGIRGVICKAGQGGYCSLPQDFINKCASVGLDWGLYWLVDSRYDSGHHLGAIKRAFPDRDFGALGWWWDCEKPRISMTGKEYRKTPYRGNGLIEAVIDKFEMWAGQRGGIYTSPGFAAMLGWSSLAFRLKSLYKKLEQMPLWVAQYNDFVEQPDLFGPWKSWTFWQYREGPDWNYFNGGEAEYHAWMQQN